MGINKLSDEYFFLTHSSEEISRWARALKYFYFVRAWGGHANDGDRFEAALSYFDKKDLFDKISLLGIGLNIISPDYPKPIPDKAYSYKEFEIFKNEIKAVPGFEQPGNIVVNGVNTNIWIEGGEISFFIAGNLDNDTYRVSESDFLACKSLELFFDQQGLLSSKSSRMESSPNCFSKQNFPDLFK